MKNRYVSVVRWALMAALAAVTITGMAAVGVRSVHGLSVANFSSISPWGLWLSMYIYFIGLSAGSFLISSLVFVFGVKRFESVGRLALLQALICLMVGLLLIGIDLGRPERFYRVFTNWGESSVLAWEVLFYTAYFAVLLAEIWLLVRSDLQALGRKARWAWARALYTFAAMPPIRTDSGPGGAAHSPWMRALAIAGIPLALGVHGGTGMIFAVVKARPYWYTGLFPILFIISALVSGGALLTFLAAFTLGGSDERKLPVVKGLARLTSYVLFVDLLLICIEAFVALYGNVPDHSTPYKMILMGPYWWVFWLVQILGGSVIPLVLVFGPGRNKVAWLGVASALIVFGVVGVRLNIVIPPLQTSWAGGLPAEFHDSLAGVGYFPSPNEWLTTLGLISLGVWAFLVLKAIVPLQPLPEEKDES